MKLITYRQNGAEHVGALTPDGSGILPLPVPDMNTLIETMDLPALRSAVAAAERGSALALSEAELLAPIPRPRQDVLCLGMNYLAHAEEAARYSAEVSAHTLHMRAMCVSELGEVLADVAGAEHEYLRTRHGGHRAAIRPPARPLVVAVSIEVLHEHENHRKDMLRDRLPVGAHSVGERGSRRYGARCCVRIMPGGVELQETKVAGEGEPCGRKVSHDDVGCGDRFVRHFGARCVGERCTRRRRLDHRALRLVERR